MWHGWGREVVHTGLWYGNLRAGDNWLDVGVDRRIIFKEIVKK
jgi:hypothetical protein